MQTFTVQYFTNGEWLVWDTGLTEVQATEIVRKLENGGAYQFVRKIGATIH